MQPVAAWLVARPHNAVLALAATLPLLQIFSGAILVFLVLQQGLRLAAIEAALAGLLLIAVALIIAAPVGQIAVSVAMTLVPALLLGLMLQATRSLTLTMQISAILAAVAMLVFQFAIGDPVAYWQPFLTMMIDWAKDNNLQLQAELLATDSALAAKMMTLAAVLTHWTMYAVYVLLGYRLLQLASGGKEVFGRFCDLNFGRVIAMVMALASVIALFSGAGWLQNVAIVLLAVFWLQGLAVVHWMHSEGQLPLFVLIATYGLMLVLHLFLILALAVLGYTDAWFGFRDRVARKRKG